MVQHDAAQAGALSGSRPWAMVELGLALTIMSAGLVGYLPFAATPYLLGVAAVCLWWRGPGWRVIGLRRPASWPRTLLVAAALGAYQFPSLYLVEPALARVTSGTLPDVSLFQPLIGDGRQLVFWLAISWTVAAFMEEMVYRGWLVARVAELGEFSRAAWIAGVLITSILFGIAHLYQGLSGVLATGLSGLIFGVAYLAGGRNLWAPILAHGLMDTIGFVMIYLGVYPGVTAT